METTGFEAKRQEALEAFVSGKDTLGRLQFGCATPRLHVVTGGVLCWSSPPITADCQPIVAYPKLGRTLHRILLVSIPDPFSFRLNIKEEKVVWLARLLADSVIGKIASYIPAPYVCAEMHMLLCVNSNKYSALQFSFKTK